MIITRETDYAIRILRALARSDLKSIREICETEYMPQQFAYKIAKKLEIAGLIEVIRGAQGGCRLKKDLHEITLWEVIHVMDRENMVTSCLNDSFVCMYRDTYDNCVMHESLCEVQDHIEAYLKKLTIYDLVFVHSHDK